MGDNSELYAGQNADAAWREELAARIERGHAAVLPGALRAAFGAEPARAFDGKVEYTLEPVTLGLTANLERIKSPLLDIVRVMREVFSQTTDAEPGTEGRMKLVKEKVAGLKFEEEQIAETVFVFTRPQKRVRKLLDSGRDKFREAAMEELGDKLHPTQMAALQRACSQHYIASFATIIGYGSPPPEGGGHEVSFPPPSPGGVTGSAGG